MLTKRQEHILKTIIKEYTQTALPVSSSLLVKKYHLDYSSATVRNEMLDLEELGFLIKQHVSAGRIPSDKGYRYFIDHLMGQRDLSLEYQRKLEMEMLQLKAQHARMSRTVAKLLSGMSQCLALSGVVDKEEYYDFGMHELLDDPEFTELDEVSRLSAALDLIDENVESILSKISDEQTKIFIGKENPLKGVQNCSMVVSPYRLKSGERGLLAIIGPKRMKYERNKGLIEYVKKMLMDRSNVFFLLISGGVVVMSVSP